MCPVSKSVLASMTTLTEKQRQVTAIVNHTANVLGAINVWLPSSETSVFESLQALYSQRR